METFIPTLNKMGFATATLDPYSRGWASFAAASELPALEIGAAFGTASIEALNLGARVFANDLDERHLDALWNAAPEKARPRLRTLPGKFPEDGSNGLNIKSETLGSILCCRVLHFFTGERIEASAEKMFDWLAPKGRAYVVAETPYVGNFSAFHPVYEDRLKKGDPWPGIVDDTFQMDPNRGANLPAMIHFLDPGTLTRIFTEAGFRVLDARTFSRPDFPEDIQWDGRESVGMIAEKPL